jgi:hypothetical protein
MPQIVFRPKRKVLRDAIYGTLDGSHAFKQVQGQKVVIKGHREGLMMNVIMKEYRVTSVTKIRLAQYNGLNESQEQHFRKGKYFQDLGLREEEKISYDKGRLS